MTDFIGLNKYFMVVCVWWYKYKCIRHSSIADTHIKWPVSIKTWQVYLIN